MASPTARMIKSRMSIVAMFMLGKMYVLHKYVSAMEDVNTLVNVLHDGCEENLDCESTEPCDEALEDDDEGCPLGT